MRRNRHGFTLPEILVVVAITSVIALALSQTIFPIGKFIQRSRVRQQASLEARVCFETIQRIMSNGRAASLVITTPATTPTLQSSQADFQGVDGSSYTITWSTSPMNTVHLQRIPPGSTVASDTILASHITGFSFGWDMNDPSIVNVSLQMKTPLDASGAPDSFLVIYLPSQTVQMVGT